MTMLGRFLHATALHAARDFGAGAVGLSKHAGLIAPLALAALAAMIPLATAPDALAASPGPAARQGTLGLGTCTSGSLEGEACVDDGDCHDGSAGGGAALCSSSLVDLEIRGFLTILSDKDSGRFESVDTVPHVALQSCSDGPFRGQSCTKNSDCRTPEADTAVCRTDQVPADFSKSTLTLILEFSRDGQAYTYAETYKDLGDYVDADLGIDCRGFCVPAGLPGSVGWREAAVEARIAIDDEGEDSGAGGGGGDGGGTGSGGGGGGRAGGEGIRIQWAQAPPAIAAALIADLGLPADSIPFLEFVDTVDIVDRSAEDDPLATVRRTKVTIRVVAPPAPTTP